MREDGYVGFDFKQQNAILMQLEDDLSQLLFLRKILGMSQMSRPIMT